MTKKDSMRKEYDLSKGERGKFFGKVDTAKPVVIDDEGTLDEIFDDELYVLESNLNRIKILRKRLPELDGRVREQISKRISSASELLDEIALSK